jgi:hypothetical protein
LDDMSDAERGFVCRDDGTAEAPPKTAACFAAVPPRISIDDERRWRLRASAATRALSRPLPGSATASFIFSERLYFLCLT